MKNKQAKQMIESITPQPTDGYAAAIGNIFPWTGDFMSPYTDGELNKSRRIFRKAQKRLSESQLEVLFELLDDDCCWGMFEIVRYYRGELVDGVDGEVMSHYVYECENGGYTGDSYGGIAYIKISGKDYLKYEYSM